MRIKPLREAGGEGGGGTPPAGGMHPNAPSPSPPAPEKFKMDVVGKGGEVFTFEDRDHIAYLASKGIQAHQEEQERAASLEEPKEKPKEEKPSEETQPSVSDVMTRLDKMEERSENEKREAKVEERRQQINQEIDASLSDIPYLKGKDSLKGRLDTLVRAELYKNPSKSVEKIVGEVAGDILGDHYQQYIEQKKASREAAPAPSGRGSTVPPMEEGPKLGKDDFKSGKIRERVVKRLRAAQTAGARPNFQ